MAMKCIKSVTHVKSCCFAHLNYCFFVVLFAAATETSKTPYSNRREELRQARRVLWPVMKQASPSIRVRTTVQWKFWIQFTDLLRAGEDKTWTRGPWTTFMDRVHGPPLMDQVHGHFLFKIMRNEQKQKYCKTKIKKNSNNNKQSSIDQLWLIVLT